jgi:hypothetical protein
MDSLERMFREYNHYCSELHFSIERMKEKMNQDFDASIEYYDPNKEKCDHTLEFYKTKEILGKRNIQFKKECRFWFK